MEEKTIFKKGDVYNSLSGCKGVFSKDEGGFYKGTTLFKKSEDVKRCFDVGDRIGGFCNGFFGREDYEDKICVAVFENYAVFQYDDGSGEVLNFPENEKCFEDGLFWNYVETWRVY